MPRKVADCRLLPADVGCTLTITGEEEEVVRAAAEHVVNAHRREDSSALREQIRRILRDEEPSPTQP